MRYVNNQNVNFVVGAVLFPAAVSLFCTANELMNPNKKVFVTPAFIAALSAMPGMAAATLHRFSENPDATRKILIEKLQLMGVTLMFAGVLMLVNASAAMANKEDLASIIEPVAMGIFLMHLLGKIICQILGIKNPLVKLAIDDAPAALGVQLFFVPSSLRLHYLPQHSDANTKLALQLSLLTASIFEIIIGNSIRNNVQAYRSNRAASEALNTVVVTTAATDEKNTGRSKVGNAASWVATQAHSLWKSAKACCARKNAETTSLTATINGV